MAVKKRKNEIFPDFFPFAVLQEKKENLEALNKADNPNDILRLIAKCEKLIAELKGGSNNDDAISEALSNLAKLKRILLNYFKNKQRKLLDMHWKQMREENEAFSRRINEQREALKKTKEK